MVVPWKPCMSSDSDPSRGAQKLASLRKLWDSRLMLGNPTHIEAPACCSSGPESRLGFGLKVCHRYSIDLCCHDEVILRETTCKQKCTLNASYGCKVGSLHRAFSTIRKSICQQASKCSMSEHPSHHQAKSSAAFSECNVREHLQ